MTASLPPPLRRPARAAVRFPVVALLAVVLATAVACGDDPVDPPVGTDPTDAASAQDVLLPGTDVAGTPDVQAEDTKPDVATAETDVSAPPDVQKPLCPGGAGCDCADNGSCDAGKCLDTPDGKKCAKNCSAGGCDKGYTCKQLDAADPSSYCLPNFLTTCSPCKNNAECQKQGATGSLCISYGDAGNFCGGACTDDGGCPESYACTEVKDAGSGATSKQCKLKSTTKPGTGADCSKGATACAKGESCVDGMCAVVDQPVCACSAWAKNAGLATECKNSNEFGACTATRKCSPDGLEACKAQTPAAEICNGDDDNCDGKIDNLAADFKCYEEGFKDGGSGAACTKDADCTATGETCDEVSSKCKLLLGKCVGTKPQCANNGQLICDAPKPANEVCNGKDDDCDGAIDEDFTWTDHEGKAVSVNTKCGVGPCADGTVLCKDQVTAVCSTASKSLKEGCNNVDDDCNGKTDDTTCDDTNVCTDDVCDGTKAACSNPPNSKDCDDKNACTSVDKCDKGGCLGTAKDCDDKDQCSADSCDTVTGVCSSKAYVGSCSDGNACSTGDACGKHPTTNAWLCLPGKDVLKCDDTNVCTDDICDTQKGCVNKANAETLPCYSADEKTKGVGVCKAGTKQCKDSKLDAVCKDEVIPAKVEACDGKDDSCDGKVDEGCKPTSVAVTFSSAFVAGKSGNLTLQMLIGPSGPVGKAKGTGKHEVDFGFLAWLMALVGGK